MPGTKGGRGSMGKLAAHIIDWAKLPEVLTPDQVCEIFGVSKPTLRNWARAGKVPCLELGSPGGKSKEYRKYSKEQIRKLTEGGGGQ